MSQPSLQAFSQLPLPEATLANLQHIGFERMTEIQAKALPPVLAGQDLLGCAKTGSGKTAVFGLGLLQQLDTADFSVQSLVLCPTRELAEQVGGEIRRLAQGIQNVKLLVICGGKAFGPQKASLKYGAHVVVGTPGRVLDHLIKGSLSVQSLKTLVLDEADRLLDMGFEEDVSAIVSRTPGNRQTLLFSATFPEAIAQMSASMQRKPKRVSVDVEHAPGVIDQLFYETTRNRKNEVLLALFEHYRPTSAVVFCHTRKQCAEVASYLDQKKIAARALHGELDQRQRDRTLALFANGSTPVLVATDVAARGLDIKSLPLVINYELPHDPEVYVHRIGRTGRAGEKGLALSLVTENELKRVKNIEEFMAQPCLMDVPASLDRDADFTLLPRMVTLQIEGGKKAKMRKGDLLGALTGDAGLGGDQIGRIDIFPFFCLVAIERDALRQAMNFLSNGKVKGRSVRARRVS